MPKLSDDTILQRAINPAVQDRVSLADAYNNEGPDAAEALAMAKAFEALRKVKLRDMTNEQLRDAFRVFVFAEQWEQSLADCSPGKRVVKECLKNVSLFREVRLRLWGTTAFEDAIANCKAVDVTELIGKKTSGPS